ncbi:hypothetical protein FVE85_7819 [Porphyridium purpureum]|uniref:Uncharacterized protein n=1 Tax=Porphyridium purpureum TaxID=35688 RepID=A0A5J4YJJ0_PORPP|nr:hypothetical protein FVE85_7819 [Porphyridium purpureum]|eukprot:POR5069..scf210_14
MSVAAEAADRAEDAEMVGLDALDALDVLLAHSEARLHKVYEFVRKSVGEAGNAYWSLSVPAGADASAVAERYAQAGRQDPQVVVQAGHTESEPVGSAAFGGALGVHGRTLENTPGLAGPAASTSGSQLAHSADQSRASNGSSDAQGGRLALEPTRDSAAATAATLAASFEHAARVAQLLDALERLTTTTMAREGSDMLFIDYRRAVALAQARAETLEKELARERQRERDEMMKRERWKTEIGSRLAALHEENQALKIANKELTLFNTQSGVELSEWKAKGEAALEENEAMRLRLNFADEMERLLLVERESTARLKEQVRELQDELTVRSHQANTALNENKRAPGAQSQTKARDSDLVLRMRERMLRTERELRAERERAATLQRLSTQHQIEAQRVQTIREQLQDKLNLMETVHAQRERQMDESYNAVRAVNQALCVWMNELQIKQMAHEPPRRRSVSPLTSPLKISDLVLMVPNRLGMSNGNDRKACTLDVWVYQMTVSSAAKPVRDGGTMGPTATKSKMICDAFFRIWQWESRSGSLRLYSACSRICVSD